MNSREGTSQLVTRLEQIGGTINLVFHDIVPLADACRSPFDVTLESLISIAAWCQTSGLCGHVRMYFDDNRRSFYDLVLGQLDTSLFAEVVVAAPITSIGAMGRGGVADLDRAMDRGVRIAPHGYSHVRLASYDSAGQRLSTPVGGLYADHPLDDINALTENEVLFQLVESSEYVNDATEFVLPYGCYNSTTLALNQRLGIYDHLATTDFEIDIGQELRPRLLIGAADTAETIGRQVIKEVSSLWRDKG